MTFKQAIYDEILKPMYILVYNHLEEMEKVSRVSIKLEHKNQVIDILSDIIVIKEKYQLDYTEDVKLLLKYKE